MKRLLILTATLLANLGVVFAKDYTIYPIPQSMEMGGGMVTITRRVSIVADKTIDRATLDRARSILQAHGYEVRMGKSRHATMLFLRTAAPTTDEGKYDRHTLVIDGSGITITGEHTNAVFYGLASLEQILEQGDDGDRYQAVTIRDYADQQNRGVIEGYYGFPYSVNVKKDLLRYMMRYKMNTYMYGGKSDPYHSRYWQKAYPETITKEQEQNGWLSQDMVRDITRTSVETKVNFIWAIHPGNHFLSDDSAISEIMSKFELMHRLGVRQFALFVDDVAIPTEVADMRRTADRVTALQKAIEDKWNHPTSSAADTVRPLHFVPQIYCSDFASSVEQRQNFMTEIGKTPPHITVYTTGQGVWTVPNSEHTANMHRELGRNMAWWWNYPCNDNADSRIYPMDMYNNFVDMPAVRSGSRMPEDLTNCIGLVANPMQQGEIAKTALFSVADYAWNNSAFDNQKSWEASFSTIIRDPEIRHAYRFVAEYLRWNEPHQLSRLIGDYRSTMLTRESKGDALRAHLHKIIDNCIRVEGLKGSREESDHLLYNDLRPWLLRLRADCGTLLALMDTIDSRADMTEMRKKYAVAQQRVLDLDTNADYSVYALEGMGDEISTSVYKTQLSQQYLEPFIDYLFRRAYTLLRE